MEDVVCKKMNIGVGHYQREKAGQVVAKTFEADFQFRRKFEVVFRFLLTERQCANKTV